MFRTSRWLLALSSLLVTIPAQSFADFSFQLGFNGVGTVLVFPNGMGPPDRYNTTDRPAPNPINIVGTSAQLVAFGNGLKILDPASTYTLNYGSDFVLSLQTELASEFVEWSGDFVPSIMPGDTEPQDPTYSEYWIYEPAPSSGNTINANFSSDIKDVGISSVEFMFNGNPTPVLASEWNFTGDDDPDNISSSGQTVITMRWEDLLPLIDLNQSNHVDLLITDVVGNTFFAGFELVPTSVPEPSSLVLLSVAALGYCGFRRRKRKTQGTHEPGAMAIAERESAVNC